MDTKTIKQTFDLLSFVEKDTLLKKAGNCQIGPCPFCGEGRDRFTIKNTPGGYRWHLRKCDHGQGNAWQDSIAYFMQRDNLSFVEAVQVMGGESGRPSGITKPKRKKPAIKVPPEDWQQAAHNFIEIANVMLTRSTDAAQARTYLLSRGIEESTWWAALLGYAKVTDPKIKTKRPCVTIPHIDKSMNVLAIKYRFFDDNTKGLRYMARKGSTLFFYGLESLLENHETLFVVEGEFNQMSILQELSKSADPDPRVSVLSPGSENINQLQKAYLPVIADRFKRVLIWTDKGKKAQQIQTAIGRPCKLMKSPNGQDANDLLISGQLGDFMDTIGIR
jgi:DNA primase